MPSYLDLRHCYQVCYSRLFLNWLCRFLSYHFVTTFSTCESVSWSGLEQSMKWWVLGPPSLRPLVSTGKEWTANFKSGTSCCSKWESSGILESCSWVREEGSGRSTNGFGLPLQWYRYCTGLSWWRESWVWKWSCWSIFVLTLNYGHKLCIVTERMKLWVQLSEPLDIELGFHPFYVEE